MFKKTLEVDPVITDKRFWVAGFFGTIPMLLMLFRPSLLEFIGFYLVDLVCYLVCLRLDMYVFHKYWPKNKLLYPTIDPEVFAIRSFEVKKSLYEALQTFPRDRALCILLVTFLKVIPSFIFVVLVWAEPGTTGMAILKGISICAFIWSFQIGLSYIGYHNISSSMLQEIHAKADWSDVFKTADLQQNKLFQRFEIMSVVSLWTFWTCMLVFIISRTDTPSWQRVVEALYVSLIGLWFSAQLISASRKQFMQGLQYLVRFFDESPDDVRSKGLALSTNSTLAYYQRTVNEMIEKNVDSEKEVHRWILRQAEDSRYLHLGRLTGLLIHDLLTPLTVMRFSVSALDEQKAVIGPSQSYMERLRFSLDQATEFIKNIRRSIRDQTNGYREASIFVAHQSASKMVSYLFEPGKFASIVVECEVSPDLKAAIPQPELNQVFLNLYSNAAKNQIENKIENARLSVQNLSETEDQFVLAVKDNGTGLSAETFRFITEEAERLPGKQGIGLKLTKRLIELYGGTMKLVKPSDNIGSEFQLTLLKPALSNRGRKLQADPS